MSPRFAIVSHFPPAEQQSLAESVAVAFIDSLMEAGEETAAAAGLGVLGCLLSPLDVLLDKEDPSATAIRLGREQLEDIRAAAEVSRRLLQLIAGWLTARLPDVRPPGTRAEVMRRVEAAALALRVHPDGAASPEMKGRGA